MNIIDLRRVCTIQRFIAPGVALAAGHSTLHSTSRQPIGESVRIMISPGATLGRRHPAELGGPQHDRIVEQPALLQVANQR